jgi:hypothetical protein
LFDKEQRGLYISLEGLDDLLLERLAADLSPTPVNQCLDGSWIALDHEDLLAYSLNPTSQELILLAAQVEMTDLIEQELAHGHVLVSSHNSPSIVKVLAHSAYIRGFEPEWILKDFIKFIRTPRDGEVLKWFGLPDLRVYLDTPLEAFEFTTRSGDPSQYVAINDTCDVDCMEEVLEYYRDTVRFLDKKAPFDITVKAVDAEEVYHAPEKVRDIITGFIGTRYK